MISTVDCYLQESGKHPILTSEEEQRLAVLINSAEIDPASQKAAQQARDRLYYANIRFAMMVTKSYKLHRFEDDLANEACVGLLQAVDNFKPGRGRFVTFAMSHIQQKIRRFVGRQQMLRIPSQIATEARVLWRTIDDFQRKNGYEPSSEELAELTGESETTIKTLLQAGRIMSCSCSSQDEDDSKTKFENKYPDDQELRPDRLLESREVTREQSRAVEMVLECLSEREYKVISLCFGLNDGESRTMEDVGQILGVCRERVRQIRNQALAKMKVVCRREKLFDGAKGIDLLCG